MKFYFSVHSKIKNMVINGSQVFDERSIVAIADTLELAIDDLKAQILAITLERGEKLELLSFQLQNIEV